MSNCFPMNSLPEPEGLQANFVYSFYSKNETIQPTKGCKVELTFKLANTIFDNQIIVSNDSYNFPSRIASGTIVVHSTADIVVSKESQINIKDSGILSKAYLSIERSCNLRSIFGNPSDKSLLLSKKLDLENSKVNKNLLQELASNSSAQSFSFFSSNEILEQENLFDINGQSISAIISDNVVFDVLKTSERNLFSKNSVYLGLLANEKLYERQDLQTSKGAKLNQFESESILIPDISITNFDEKYIRRVATQIERTEILTNGQTIKKTFVISPSVTTYVDTEVKYGTKYSYCAKSIYILQIQGCEPVEGTDDPEDFRIFISSVPSNLATVTTVEKVPPPYPADVSFRFDYQKSELSVKWEFPVNKVQDITRFQIFRRTSSKEPFLLLKELDFDKSEFKVERPDQPLTVNVSILDQSTRSYVDKDFGRSSKYIYSIASVDAHGYASNYSSQYEVSFDMRAKSLKVRCVSPGGAPRPYPNLYFDTNRPLIDDSITRGKVSSMNFVFDPEYLRVNDNGGNDLNLIRFQTEGAKYYINVIDTNRAEQISIPVEIYDFRTT